MRAYLPEHAERSQRNTMNIALDSTYDGMAGIDEEIICRKEDAIISMLRWLAAVSCPPFRLGSNSNEHPGGMDVIALISGTIRLRT